MKATAALYKKYGMLILAATMFSIGMGCLFIKAILELRLNGDPVFMWIMGGGIFLEVALFRYSILPLFRSYRALVEVTEKSQ